MDNIINNSIFQMMLKFGARIELGNKWLVVGESHITVYEKRYGQKGVTVLYQDESLEDALKELTKDVEALND